MGAKRIIAVGDMVADVLLPPLPDLPEGDMQLLLEGLELSPGGNTLNFALAASAFGAEVDLHAARGDDPLGQFLASWVPSFGARDLTRTIAGARTATTVAIPDRTGGRRLLTCPGTNALFKVTPDDLDLGSALHLHTGGYWFQPSMAGPPLRRLLEACRDAGIETSMDPATNPRGWDGDDVRELSTMLGLVDVLFLNMDELIGLTGPGDEETCAGMLLDTGVRSLVLHKGERGASLITKGKYIDRKAFPVPEPLNPTGCGDVLNGCFIASRALGSTDEQALGLGVAAASLHLASRAPRYPTLAEASDLLMRTNPTQY